MAVDVEGLINSNWTRAVARAESIAATTQSLVSFAANVMSTFQPNFPNDAIRFDELKVVRDPTNPLPPFTWYPQTGAPSFPSPPSLPTVPTVDGEIKAVAPKLSFPTFKYRTISDLPPFNDVAPDVDSRVDVPKPPVIGNVTKPSLVPIDPNDYALDKLVLPPFDPIPVDYQPGQMEDFYTAFAKGQSALPTDIDDSLLMLDKSLPGLSVNYKALSDRINGVLTRQETALGEDFDAALFEALRQKVENETRSQLQQLDDSRSGGWQMPGAARFAAQRQIEIASQQANNAAALQVYIERRKTELQHLQFVMGLCNNMLGVLGTFIASIHNNHLEAYRAALSYASEAVRYSQAAYSLLQRDTEIRIAVLNSAIALFEAKLKYQLAKVQLLKEEYGIKSDLNDQLLKQYIAELTGEETQAKLYASEIAGLTAMIDARLIPLKVYSEKIKAYSALAEAKKAEYGVVMAEIEGDKVRMEGEIAKMNAYDAEIRAFATGIDAKSKIALSQIERAKLILDQFKVIVDAELSRIRADTEISGQTLDAYKSRVAAYVAEQETAIRGAQLEFDSRKEKAIIDLQQLSFNQERILKAIELEMNRKKSVAEVNGQMAGVMGSMANAAQSALNNVLSAGVNQSA